MLKEIKNLFKIKGKNRKETLENLSFVLMVVAAIMISLGLALASFIKYIILLSTFGSFLLLVGIILFVFNEIFDEE